MQIELWHAILATTIISWAFFMTGRGDKYDGFGGSFLAILEVSIAIIVTLVAWLIYFIIF